MTIRLRMTALLVLGLSLYATSATALTMKQFSDICHSSSGTCSDHPIVQAYVGGALDLLATLDEKTNYLNKLYCKEPKELFDVPAIVRFMEQRSKQYATNNAMLVLLRYVEEHGDCTHE